VTIHAWIRDRPQLSCLGSLPEGIEIHALSSDGGALPAEIDEAEFLVPPHGGDELLERLAEMPRLAVVQAASAGTEWLEPWIPDGVTLCSARGARDTAVAEWVLAVILAMEKRLPELAIREAEHVWRPELLDELAGKRALIVGYGSIGRRVAAMLSALGVFTQGVTSRERGEARGVEDLAELLPAADIVVVLVPLTPATRGLFDARMLARMRPGALLVNAARGPVIDTAALLEQLMAGRLRAVLDVTDPEPLPSDHPLWAAPGVILTPHLAGDSPQAEERVYRLIGEQLRRYAGGEELTNVVRGPSTRQRLR
jgi:phosphoglycerate dehydrogenase-like enzyme